MNDPLRSANFEQAPQRRTQQQPYTLAARQQTRPTAQASRPPHRNTPALDTAAHSTASSRKTFAPLLWMDEMQASMGRYARGYAHAASGGVSEFNAVLAHFLRDAAPPPRQTAASRFGPPSGPPFNNNPRPFAAASPPGPPNNDLERTIDALSRCYVAKADVHLCAAVGAAAGVLAHAGPAAMVLATLLLAGSVLLTTLLMRPEASILEGRPKFLSLSTWQTLGVVVGTFVAAALLTATLSGCWIQGALGVIVGVATVLFAHDHMQERRLRQTLLEMIDFKRLQSV